MANELKLFILLYTDADVDTDLAAKVRQQGFDALSALEAGKTRLKDDEQLDFATAQQRAILTHNQKHFAPMHEKWLSEGREHAGIILSTQVPMGELLHRTIRLLDQVTADEMRNNLRYLNDFADRKK